MRLLISGATGQLGRALSDEFARRGHGVIGFDKDELDVCDRVGVRAKIGEARPDVIIHCAAYTDVDGAEDDREGAFRINAEAAALLAAECQRIGARFVYPSTDYVFNGESDKPWAPSDPTNPLNVYGESKVAGEEATLSTPGGLVVRTSWLYHQGGRNFVETVLERARNGIPLEIVDDQVGRPTWGISLAAVVAGLVERQSAGIFHATDGGVPVSWYRFAVEILSVEGISAELVPVPSDRNPRKAARPRYSVLDCGETERVLGRPMMDWKVSLGSFLTRGTVS